MPGWVGRLALAGAAAGLVLARAAGGAPPAEPDRAAAPGAPAVLLAGAALGGGPLVATPTVRPGAAPAPAPGAPPSAAGDATPRIVAAANTLLTTLTDAQRAAAIFSFDDTTVKAQWSNFPSCCYPWVGVRMGELSAAQQQFVWDLLTVTLGEPGTQRVRASVNADEQLRIASPGTTPGSARRTTSSPSSALPPRPRPGCSASAATT